jgi:hypothetical protein
MDTQVRNKESRSRWPVITALMALVLVALVFLGLGMLPQLVSAQASSKATPVTTQKESRAVGGTATPCASTQVVNEGFEGGTLGVFTNTVIITSTTTPVPTPGWASVVTNPHSGTRSAFAPDPDKTTDSRLTTINNINIPAGVSTATLTFWHRFAFENQFDGGVLEVSTDGGTTWTDADANIQQGGYNGTIAVFQSCVTAGTPPPFPAGKRVWTSSQTTYGQVRVNLLPYQGTNMKFRFRLGTDCSVSNTGWNVDDVVVSVGGGVCATGTPPLATNTPPPGASPTPGCTVTDVVVDGSFEGGTPSTAWTEKSSNFGTPLCNSACGSGGGTAGPRTGEWWAWFGGTSSVEDGAVSQTVNIPAGGATLRFYLWIGAHSGGGIADFLRVLVGETEVFRADDTSTQYDAGYMLVSVPVTAVGSAILRIEEHNGTTGTINFNVDDVSLTAAVGCPTGTPGATNTVVPPTLTSTRTAMATNTTTPIRTATLTRTATPIRTATATPGRGAISGRAYLRTHTPGQEAVNARVYACKPGYCSPSVFTNAQGDYLLSNLPPGTYEIIAFPPSGHNVMDTRRRDIVVSQGQTVTGQDLVFLAPIPPPANMTIQPSSTNANGIPNVNWQNVLTITLRGCPGGSGTYQMVINEQVVRSGPVTEYPIGSGIYIATISALHPLHGGAMITIVINCPDGSTITIVSTIYIDPSGVVQSYLPNGTPAALPLATVVLYRSDDPAGPFDVVPDGSALMSPGNRENPDITRLGGHFGWDVVTGYYVVRASKAGCAKPGDPTQLYVDSYIMEIPPPVTDLDLRLDCGSPTFTDVHTGDFFYNSATYLAAIGVLGGYGTTAQCPTGVPCFLPANDVTRGQAAKIIANAAGMADVIPDTQQTFQDVDPTDNPFWVYIERMAKHGYVGGYPCGGLGEECMPGNKPYFRWGNNVTRNQLAKILVLAHQYATINPADPHFQDVSADNTFYAYVETAYQKGLIGGYPCGGPFEPCVAPANKPYFRGGANATRGQLSKMVTQTLISPAP